MNPYVYNKEAKECQHKFALMVGALCDEKGLQEGKPMGSMKYFYYGFGGFIGFVCGLVIQMIFYAVERSGNPILTQLGRGDYGILGQGFLELYNNLHFLGIVFGVLLVRLMFKKEIEKEGPDEGNCGPGDLE